MVNIFPSGVEDDFTLAAVVLLERTHVQSVCKVTECARAIPSRVIFLRAASRRFTALSLWPHGRVSHLRMFFALNAENVALFNAGTAGKGVVECYDGCCGIGSKEPEDVVVATCLGY